MMEWTHTAEGWASLGTLTLMEVVLGIDNLVFLSILANKLPQHQQQSARRMGLAAAALSRLGLLLGIGWIVSLTEPLFHIRDKDFTGKSLILLGGGLFLIYKATKEIHHKMEPEASENGEIPSSSSKRPSFGSVIAQIMIIDIVFSLDSVITAVGMTPFVSLMIVANVIALVLMLIFSTSISDIVNDHPSIKMLALSFLLLIGALLLGEGFGYKIPKGYLYFAMAFSLAVEVLNLKSSSRTKNNRSVQQPPS